MVVSFCLRGKLYITKLEIYSIKPNFKKIAHQNLYLYFDYRNKKELNF